jgi:hypothetical protein
MKCSVITVETASNIRELNVTQDGIIKMAAGMDQAFAETVENFRE